MFCNQSDALKRMENAGFDPDEIEDELYWLGVSRRLLDAPTREPMRSSRRRRARNLGTVRDGMAHFSIDGCDVRSPVSLKVTIEEARAAYAQAKRRMPYTRIESITFKSQQAGSLEFEFCFEKTDFERIRRITGYLVGTTARFNDAKRAEERDRVAHAIA